MYLAKVEEYQNFEMIEIEGLKAFEIDVEKYGFVYRPILWCGQYIGIYYSGKKPKVSEIKEFLLKNKKTLASWGYRYVAD